MKSIALVQRKQITIHRYQEYKAITTPASTNMVALVSALRFTILNALLSTYLCSTIYFSLSKLEHLNLRFNKVTSQVHSCFVKLKLHAKLQGCTDESKWKYIYLLWRDTWLSSAVKAYTFAADLI